MRGGPMAQHKYRDGLSQVNKPIEAENDNFFEAMPFASMPHAIYRDDTEYAYHDEYIDQIDGDEIWAAKRNLTALATIALVVLIASILLAAVLYGLSMMDGAAAASSLSSGSLEL
jgi:hypothetical protein